MIYHSTDKGLTKQTKNIFDKSLIELQTTDEKEIKTIHILLSILKDKNNIVHSTLDKLRIDYNNVLETYINIHDKYDDNDEDSMILQMMMIYLKIVSKEKVRHSSKRSKTPTLDNFGRDLTLLAAGKQIRSYCRKT